MAQCPNCRNSIPEESTFCPVCGTAIHIDRGYTGYRQTKTSDIPVCPSIVPKPASYDHSKEFESDDIAETRLICMLVYLLDFFGIIIALLAAKDSAYTQFHTRQSMKYTVLELLLVFASAMLCWTVIIPAVCAIALCVLLVLKFVSFTEVCSGKAMEPPLIRDLKFLK